MKLLLIIELLVLASVCMGQFNCPDIQPVNSTVTCEPSLIECEKFYNWTFFPNGISTDIDSARNDLQLYQSLVVLGCSQLSELLVCLAFSPQCTGDGQPRLPCVDLCNVVAEGCGTVAAASDFRCLLQCDRYSTTDCIGLDDPLVTGLGFVSTESTNPPPTTTFVPYNTTDECPAQKFFTDSAKSFATGWLAFWSVVCFLSTALTLATFLLDPSRFLYPWRPVIYLALSFNLHSLTHFFAMIIGRDTVTCPGGEFVQASTTWTWEHTPCILVFGLLYFTMLAAFLWWLILSFGWFLTSAFSWSSEAVAHLAPFYHVVAWILPLLFTIVLVATRVVGADELTGICFIVRDDGNMSFLALLLGVIIPLIVCLLTGIVLLSIGFISILKIRSLMRSRGKSAESSILEKLVLRIGVFVVVFIIPACIVIGCFVYELVSRPFWTPVDDSCSDCVKANPAVFMVRLFMFLLTGILTGVWIWSKKTVSSWRMCPQKLVECCKMPKDVEETPSSVTNGYVSNGNIYGSEHVYSGGENVYSGGEMDEVVDKL